MKANSQSQALKTYQKAGGSFTTGSRITPHKEADLASFYYPGITAVLDKIQKKPGNQVKYCRHHRTIGLISTKPVTHYPLLSAKAALLSTVADMNVIPLMVRYRKVKNLPITLEQLAINFQAIYCTDLSNYEQEVLRAKYHHEIPLLFREQTEAAAIMAAVMNGTKWLKKTPKKIQITIEGADMLISELVRQLLDEKMSNLTFIDESGPLYLRRPKLNKDKIKLVKLTKAAKDERSRVEILAQTDIYIVSLNEAITAKTTGHLPDNAVIISLKSEQIEKKAKQALVSTLPSHPNHLTDLHIMTGISTALADGHKFSENTLSQATKALAGVFKSPKADKIIPGLLEKNLAQKIAKGIK